MNGLHPNAVIETAIDECITIVDNEGVTQIKPSEKPQTIRMSYYRECASGNEVLNGHTATEKCYTLALGAQSELFLEELPMGPNGEAPTSGTIKSCECFLREVGTEENPIKPSAGPKEIFADGPVQDGPKLYQAGTHSIPLINPADGCKVTQIRLVNCNDSKIVFESRWKC